MKINDYKQYLDEDLHKFSQPTEKAIVEFTVPIKNNNRQKLIY